MAATSGILRESERAKTFHRLCDVRDQDSNKMASVAASKALEQISEEAVSRPAGPQQMPGFVIVIADRPAHPERPPPLTIDVNHARDGEGGG
jgi:hypothetical protein